MDAYKLGNLTEERKRSVSYESAFSPKRHKSQLDSPREVSRKKEDNFEMNMKLIEIKSQLKKLNSLALEQEIKFNSQKESMINELQKRKDKIKKLEFDLKDYQRRENMLKMSVEEYKNKNMKLQTEFTSYSRNKISQVSDLRHQVVDLESKVIRLKAENKYAKELQAELTKTKEELQHFANMDKILKRKEYLLALSNAKIESLENELQIAKRKTRNLENDKGNYAVLKKLVEEDMEIVPKYPILERELQQLTEENRRLQIQCQEKLILDGTVNDLKSRNKALLKQQEEYAKQISQLKQMEAELKNWIEIGNTFFEDTPTELMPNKIKSQLELNENTITIQYMEITNLQNTISEMTKREEEYTNQLCRHKEIEAQLLNWINVGKIFCADSPSESMPDKMKRLFEVHATTIAVQVTEIENLQHKLSEMMKENEVINVKIAKCCEVLASSKSAIGSLLKKIDENKSRLQSAFKGKNFIRCDEQTIGIHNVPSIESLLTLNMTELEHWVKNVELHIEFLEEVLEARETGSDFEEIKTKISTLLSERNQLQSQIQNLRKTKDDLDVEIELRASIVHNNVETTKGLQLKNSPLHAKQEQLRNELNILRKECKDVEKRLEILEDNDTRIVEELTPPEVAELREKLKISEVKVDKFRALLGGKIKEFKYLFETLMGYKLDIVTQERDKIYRLTSIYVDSEQYLSFKLQSDENLELLQSPYQTSVMDLVEEHLLSEGNFPSFLAAVTLRLWESRRNPMICEEDLNASFESNNMQYNLSMWQNIENLNNDVIGLQFNVSCASFNV